MNVSALSPIVSASPSELTGSRPSMSHAISSTHAA
jgi:hypothetical protein